MKVLINSKTKPTEKKDFHSNGNSLNEMIKSTSQNIRKNVIVEKEDNFVKTFNKSISKTLKQKRKYYPD